MIIPAQRILKVVLFQDIINSTFDGNVSVKHGVSGLLARKRVK